MSSDSDSDLEALQSIYRAKKKVNRVNGSTSGPNATATGSFNSSGAPAAFNSTLNGSGTSTANPTYGIAAGSTSGSSNVSNAVDYEILGENAILRSKLNKIETENQRALNELIAKQAQQEQQYKEQVEKFRNLYETERSLHLLLIGDKNLSIGTKRSPSRSSPHQPPSKRKPPPEFSDGFSVPPSVAAALSAAVPAVSDSLASSHPVAAVARASAPEDESQIKETSQLVQFLLAHKTPGFNDLSIQVLFDVPGTDGSVGHSLLQTKTLSALVAKLLNLIGSETFDSDLRTLYLSLLYESQFIGIGMTDECLHTTPTMLCQFLTQWFDILVPLPDFDKLDAMTLVRLDNIRVLTCVLYVLDILLATSWIFEFPLDIANRIVECNWVPQLRSRGYDLFAKYPRSEFGETVFAEFPSEPSPVTMELVFGGFRDPQPLTAAQLAASAPTGSRYARLCPQLADLQPMKELARLKAEEVFEYSLLASIRMAYSFVPIVPSMAKADNHVLKLLQKVVTVGSDSVLMECCVFYLWRRTTMALRESFQGSVCMELCVCLSKIIYGGEDTPVTHWAKDLMERMAPTVGFDMNAMFARFG